MAYPRFQRARAFKFVTGSLAGDHSTASTTFVDINAAYSMVLNAQVNDVLELMFNATASAAALARADFCWNVAGTDKTPYLDFDVATNPIPCSALLLYTVQAGDISSGTVTVKPRYKTSTSTLTVQNSSSRGPVVLAQNLGPVDPS